MRSASVLQASIGERQSAVFSADLRELFERNGDALRQADANTALDMIVRAAMQALSIRDVTDLDAYAESLTDTLLLIFWNPASWHPVIISDGVQVPGVGFA